MLGYWPKSHPPHSHPSFPYFSQRIKFNSLHYKLNKQINYCRGSLFQLKLACLKIIKYEGCLTFCIVHT